MAKSGVSKEAAEEALNNKSDGNLNLAVDDLLMKNSHDYCE